MNQKLVFATFILVLFTLGNMALADTFGEGANQFQIDFVSISTNTNPTTGRGIVNNDYRMGMYEITNEQWNKFVTSLGMSVTGSDGGYGYSAVYTGANTPINQVNWYSAAQFVNWLNTSTGHQPAYKFTGTQGTSDYTFAAWSAVEAANGTDLYRNKNAVYFLPTTDEWFKAAFWNGSTLQNYATKDGSYPTQGDGVSGTGWNYGFSIDHGPWNVNNGSEELNGTFNMMGNDWEWLESPSNGIFTPNSSRDMCGNSWYDSLGYLSSSGTDISRSPSSCYPHVSFRVAATVVPEPSTFVLLGMGLIGLAAYVGKRRKVAK